MRIGFLGLGWIGRARLRSALALGGVEAAVLADPHPEAVEEASRLAPAAERCGSLEALLRHEGLQGVVIATPSALHAEQSVRALEHGLPVFCQKPLGRDGREVRRVLAAARAAGRRLGVDLSYRHTQGMRRIRELIHSGKLGEVYAAQLTFHNAYGPDKPWFYDPRQSGGGCLLDLGIHLIDLALWTLDFPAVAGVSARLFSRGRVLDGRVPADRWDGVEDYAVARLDLEGGAAVCLSCSWNLPAGQAALIEACFYGTDGGAALHNVDGSFYDFRALRLRGTSREVLSEPPDDWGAGAIGEWVEALRAGGGFDPETERLAAVADAIDRIYGRA